MHCLNCLCPIDKIYMENGEVFERPSDFPDGTLIFCHACGYVMQAEGGEFDLLCQAEMMLLMMTQPELMRRAGANTWEIHRANPVFKRAEPAGTLNDPRASTSLN